MGVEQLAFFSFRTLAKQKLSYRILPNGCSLYTKWNQTFGNGHEKVDFKAVDQMLWHYFYIKTCHNG